MGSDRIAVRIDGGVAHVELARPDKFNAMDEAMFAAIGDTFRALGRDPAVRAILLSGRGRHFTAGLDLDYASRQFPKSKDPGRAAEARLRHIEWLQDAFSAVERARAPVIAAVHGGCIGAGVDLAAACDLRVASADAFLQIAEVDVAITADLGTLQRLGGWARRRRRATASSTPSRATGTTPSPPAWRWRGPSPPNRRSRSPAPRRASTTAAAGRSRRVCAMSPCGTPQPWSATILARRSVPGSARPSQASARSTTRRLSEAVRFGTVRQ